MDKGFSLIEVLIVIAIVAMLAFLAIPAWRSYQQRTAITKIINIAKDISDKAIIYANMHGTFPNARQLGFPEDPQNPGNVSFADPDAVSPDVSLVQIADIGGGCGSDLRVVLYLSSDNIFTGGDTFALSYDVFNIQGTLIPFCQYVYNAQPMGPYVASDLIPSCINNYSGSYLEWSQLQSQATCQ